MASTTVRWLAYFTQLLLKPYVDAGLTKFGEVTQHHNEI